jgi:hypothetical protein
MLLDCRRKFTTLCSCWIKSSHKQSCLALNVHVEDKSPTEDESVTLRYVSQARTYRAIKKARGGFSEARFGLRVDIECSLMANLIYHTQIIV